MNFKLQGLVFALVAYSLLLSCVMFTASGIIAEVDIIEPIQDIELNVVWATPTPTPTPTLTPTPTVTPTPTPPIEAITDEDVSPQEFYDACLARGMITGVCEEDHITKERGGCMGPSGRETYYNLKMDLCVWYMRELGYDEEEYPYWIRDDGAKMLGIYVMCAANWSIRPKGTILPTSLGDAIVVDTGDFVADFPYGIDLAVDW